MSVTRSARSRSTAGLLGALALGFLALRPSGGLIERVAEAALLPARALGPLALPTRVVEAARASDDRGSDAERFAAESALAQRLEAAILKSAWPEDVVLPRGAVATLGEVDARSGTRDRDMVRVRVLDPGRVRVGQGVVSGDVFLGRVARVHFRAEPPRKPSRLTRALRALRVLPAPVLPPPDAIDVALITGASERIGAVVEPMPEDEALGVRPSRLVVGGVVPGAPTVHLGTHVPESRSARRGAVRVSEPDVPGATGALGADELRLCDGFLIGRLQELDIARRGALGTDERGIVQEILGVAPPVDFLSGLNQVLVLGRARPGDPPSVPLRASVPAQAGVWRSASVLGVGDACPWRDTLRIGAGARSGVARGAAVVDGARLLGRVTRADAAGATVARLSDPGTEIVLLASHAAAPDAVPLVLGRLVARGAGGGGELLLEWSPTPVELDRARAWAARLGHGGDFLDVRLFTGSGMRLVPRGLLVGRTRLPVHVRRTEEQGPGAEGEPALDAPSEPALDAPSEPALDAASEPTLDADVQPGFDVRLLRVGGTASARGALRVWLGPGKAAGADA